MMASGCKQPTTEEIAVEASLWVLLLLFVLVFLVAILWIALKACGLTGDQGYRAYLKQVREATGEPVGHRKGGVDDGEDSNSDDDDTDYGDDPMDGGAATIRKRKPYLSSRNDTAAAATTPEEKSPKPELNGKKQK